MPSKTDATHVRKLLRFLRERDQQFELAARCAGLGIWKWNFHTNEVTWSERCRELLGVSQHVQASADLFYSVVHPDDRARVAEEYARARRSRDPLDHEYRILLPDGAVRRVHSSCRTMFRRDGIADCALGVLREIGEHQVAPADIAVGRHHAAPLSTTALRQLIESAAIGILFTDADGACRYANAAWLDVCAVTLEQARDLGWWAAIHPDDRERVTDAWEGLSRGEPFDLEFRYQRPSGETRWVHGRASEIRDPAGVVLGYVSAEMDITEQLQERAALDRMHSRIRLLAHRLEQTLEEERDELAGTLQGQLRQDLTTLRWEIEALGANADPAVLGRALDLAHGCIERLRRIAFDLHPPAVEELGLIEAVKRHADEQAAQYALAVKVAVTGPLPKVDPRRALVLYRAFQEALANTIRHAQAKHVEVSIAVLERTLRLRVVDDGIGLNESDRNKSDCFGLLAASERVARIGGALRVFGVAGRGTTLEVSVPLSKESERDPAES